MLLYLAIAISKDTLVVGFTLNLLQLDPYISMIIIGMVTFICSFLGVYIGSKGGGFLAEKAERVGGIILIALV